MSAETKKGTNKKLSNENWSFELDGKAIIPVVLEGEKKGQSWLDRIKLIETRVGPENLDDLKK